MTTLAQAVTKIVNDSIDHEYLAGQSLRSVYDAEYGINYGVGPNPCKNYLQGLPSVCTIPFANGEILVLLAAQGITRKSENARYSLIDLYWETAGQCFYKLIK